jgi:dTDP-4-dehydrorhamnose 3,5-epimerase
MKFTATTIPGCWLIESDVHLDDRGGFQEWFKSSQVYDSTGANFVPAQANFSVSKKNVLRGIHFSLNPLGQSKIVFCAAGKILDYIVDLDTSSATFGQWTSFELSPEKGSVLLIGPKTGHGFLSLQDNTVVTYLLSSEYSQKDEFEVSFLDEILGINLTGAGHILSEKDQIAPGIMELRKLGRLPGLLGGA